MADAVKLSAADLEGATEIAPVKLSADELAGAEEIGAPRSFLGEATHRAADFGRSVVENVKNIPSTSLERIGTNARALAEPFVQAGREVADEVTHPVRTLRGAPLARAVGYSTPGAEAHADAVNREVVRGVQANIPLAGLAHERLTGFPERSEADAAEAPHAAGAGQVAGMAGLALAPKAVPLLGRGLRTAANATQDAVAAGTEATIARSAARHAVSETPVRDAAKALAHDVTDHAVRHGALATGAHMLGGHKAAAVAAGLSLAKPALRTAGIAADEGLAAIARRAVGRQGTPVAASELREAATAPTPIQTPSRETLFRAPEPAAPVADVVAASVEDPAIAAARAALADKATTPAQADTIRKALAGLEARGARKGPASAPRAAEPGPVVEAQPVEDAPLTPEASPERQASSKMQAYRQRLADAEEEKFAKRLGVSVEKYREGKAQYHERVKRVAALAKSTASKDDFVEAAAAGGFPKHEAGWIWDKAHGERAAAGGAP